MSMINTMGDDTYRASMLKNENFYEYLISYNDLTYPQVEALRDTIRTAEEPGWVEYLNSKGQETLYAYSTDSQWGWTLIASIEMKELQGASVQWTILIVSGFTFGMLYLVNSAYFRSLNRQLRSSLTQLETANSAKTRFLSSMSHDIRTPMNAILGMTAIAEKQLNDRERLEDCLHKIDLAGNHLLTLVNDILDISQIESGRLTFRPSVFSLEESAADLVNLLYHQAEDKHLRAEVHILDAHQNYLYADKGRLNQIWINLLSNAIKYTPDGGRVDIYLDEKDIPGQPEQVRLTFQVKDTGVGISQEFQKVLFDSFTRGKDSRIDTIQGSGLGIGHHQAAGGSPGRDHPGRQPGGRGLGLYRHPGSGSGPGARKRGTAGRGAHPPGGGAGSSLRGHAEHHPPGGLDRLRPRWGARRRDPPGPGRCGDALLLGHPGPAHGGPGLSRGGAGPL